MAPAYTQPGRLRKSRGGVFTASGSPGQAPAAVRGALDAWVPAVPGGTAGANSAGKGRSALERDRRLDAVGGVAVVAEQKRVGHQLRLAAGELPAIREDYGRPALRRAVAVREVEAAEPRDRVHPADALREARLDEPGVGPLARDRAGDRGDAGLRVEVPTRVDLQVDVEGGELRHRDIERPTTLAVEIGEAEVVGGPGFERDDGAS